MIRLIFARRCLLQGTQYSWSASCCARQDSQIRARNFVSGLAEYLAHNTLLGANHIAVHPSLTTLLLCSAIQTRPLRCTISQLSGAGRLLGHVMVVCDINGYSRLERGVLLLWVSDDY